jgi:hypothetical protein
MECPPRRKKARLPGGPPPADVDPDDLSPLPGSNVYDRAVTSGRIDYSTAKTREEVALVAEKLEQAKLATEQARIDLDKHKLELQQARGSVITKEEYLSRQDSLVSAFLELTRLLVNEACLPLASSIRVDHQSKMTALARNGMEAIANCVMAKAAHEQVNAALLQVFTGDE